MRFQKIITDHCCYGHLHTLYFQVLSKHLGPADERLALHVLHTFPHVKEHVETRSLYLEEGPGIVQVLYIVFIMAVGIDTTCKMFTKH